MIPMKVCPDCSEQFFTTGGLAEHRASNCRIRWDGTLVHPIYTPKGLKALRESAQRMHDQVNAQRRRCECGMTSTPGPLGLHQRTSGHTGWTELEPVA